ncbi:hypothetical protein OC846_003018 [Tilletia horrida]|uniref:Uncharacterized protein n=1 Tax=Tilletia horrida TaxID=155126 RepID=A0AAN6GQU7_9BASI|nr:hypothetical protein OC845_004971 [Tilletia horrida]KAK0552167.1 hypothetical protein OC846_003018 [Tilletia horrida]
MPAKRNPHPVTPDGHYFLWNGWQLWRCTDPNLKAADRESYTAELMSARRAVSAANKLTSPADKKDALAHARARVQKAKEALGERGEPWWDASQKGAEVVDRKHVKNTQYAAWAEGLLESGTQNSIRRPKRKCREHEAESAPEPGGSSQRTEETHIPKDRHSKRTRH